MNDFYLNDDGIPSHAGYPLLLPKSDYRQSILQLLQLGRTRRDLNAGDLKLLPLDFHTPLTQWIR
jgi:hypothetical protein